MLYLSILCVVCVVCVALGNATSVLSMLEDRVYMPKDTVVMYDDFPDGMYFIDNGVLGVYSQTDELLAELSEGSFFGEIALLLDRKRSASVLALTWCNVKMLSKTNFDSVLKGKKSFVQHTCRCCCCIVVVIVVALFKSFTHPDNFFLATLLLCSSLTISSYFLFSFVKICRATCTIKSIPNCAVLPLQEKSTKPTTKTTWSMC